MKAPLYTANVYSTKLGFVGWKSSSGAEFSALDRDNDLASTRLGIARLCHHFCGFMNWAPNPMLIKPMRPIQANLRSPPQ
jgi:hypothetical protein